MRRKNYENVQLKKKELKLKFSVTPLQNGGINKNENTFNQPNCTCAKISQFLC